MFLFLAGSCQKSGDKYRTWKVYKGDSETNMLYVNVNEIGVSHRLQRVATLSVDETYTYTIDFLHERFRDQNGYFATKPPWGTLNAVDLNTGEVLWEYQLPAVGYATPSTYEIDGKQYVVIAATGGSRLGTNKSDTFIAFTLPDDI